MDWKFWHWKTTVGIILDAICWFLFVPFSLVDVVAKVEKFSSREGKVVVVVWIERWAPPSLQCDACTHRHQLWEPWRVRGSRRTESSFLGGKCAMGRKKENSLSHIFSFFLSFSWSGSMGTLNPQDMTFLFHWKRRTPQIVLNGEGGRFVVNA